MTVTVQERSADGKSGVLRIERRGIVRFVRVLFSDPRLAYWYNPKPKDDPNA